MSDVLNIPSKNSYLTSKQWEEVVEYVKNRKNVVEEPIVEEITEEPRVMMFASKSVAQNSYAYTELVQATSVSDMYEILLMIMNESPDELHNMTSDELQSLYDNATQMNEENQSDDYQDLADTLQYLAGDYDLNGAEVLATETWSGEIGAKTYTGTDNVINISGNCILTGKITISNNAAVTIIGSGVLTRASNYVGELFNVYGSATLTIKGTSTSTPIIIDGGSTGTKKDVRTMMRIDHNLNLENVELRNNNTTVARDYTVIDNWDNTLDNFAGGAITLCDNENNVTIKNCKIYDNTAQKGAGIYLNRKGYGTLLIENTTFSNCDALSSGGAIFFDGELGKDAGGIVEVIPDDGFLNYTVTITNTTIENCDALGGCGSAIYMHHRGNADITMTGCTVQNCVSNTGSCGTIRCDGNSRYKLTVDNCLIQNNESTSGHGGGIYWNALGNGSALVVKNSRILNNVASSMGGGMFVEGSSITVTNTTISGNIANMGGGIGIKTFADSGYKNDSSVNSRSFNLNLGNGVIVENNVATSMGGGISYDIVDGIPDNGFTFNYTNDGAIIRNNIASSEGSITGVPDGIGGGVAIINDLTNNTYYANIYMKSGSIDGNRAKDGAGFHITIGNFEMDGGTIENHVSSGDGGAIYMAGGNFTMTDGVFNNNTSEISGGAVCVTNGNAHIHSGVITDNIALDRGGALYVSNGNVIIGAKECHDAGASSIHSHPVIKNNIASDGGGLYVNGGTTTMWCGDIKHNHTYEKTVNVLVTNGSFTYNGGSIGIPYDTGVFVTGGVFDDNVSEAEGKIKHELHYNSTFGDMNYNGRIPESKWIASPRVDVLHIGDSDDTSPTWADLFPEYEFVGWEQGESTDEMVTLNAIWEKK